MDIRAYMSPQHLPGIDEDYRPDGFLGPSSAEITRENTYVTVKTSLTNDTRFLKGYKHIRGKIIDRLHQYCEARASDFYTTTFTWKITNPYQYDSTEEAGRPYELMVEMSHCDACNIIDLRMLGHVQGAFGWSTPVGYGDCPSTKSDAFPWNAGDGRMFCQEILPGEAIVMFYNLNESVLSFPAGWSVFYTKTFTGGIVTGSTGGGLDLRWNVWCEEGHISVCPTDFYGYQVGDWIFLLRDEYSENTDVYTSGSNYDEFAVQEPGYPNLYAPDTLPDPVPSAWRPIPVEFVGLGNIRYGNTSDPCFSFDLPSDFYDMIHAKLYEGELTDVDYVMDTGNVTIAGRGSIDSVPIYYHCGPNIEIEGGSSAFAVGDRVLVLDVDGELKIVGLADGLALCECSFILKMEIVGVGCYFWDVMNDLPYDLRSDGAPVPQPVPSAWVTDFLRQGTFTDTNTYTPWKSMTGESRNLSFTDLGGGNYTWSADHFLSLHTTIKTRTNLNNTVGCHYSPWELTNQTFRTYWTNPIFLEWNEYVWLDYDMPLNTSHYDTVLDASGAQSIIIPWDDGKDDPIGSWTSIQREDQAENESFWEYMNVIGIPCHVIAKHYLRCDRTVFGTPLSSYQIFYARDIVTGFPYNPSTFQRFPWQTMYELVDGHISLGERFVKNYSFVNNDGAYPVKAFIMVVPNYYGEATTEYWNVFDAYLRESENGDASVDMFGRYGESPSWVCTSADPPFGYHRDWEIRHPRGTNPQTYDSYPNIHYDYGKLGNFKVIQGFANKTQYAKEGHGPEECTYRYNHSEYRTDCPNFRAFFEYLLNTEYPVLRFCDFHHINFQFYVGPLRGLKFGAPPRTG